MKKTTKRLMSLALAAIIGTSFTGCGSNKKQANTDNSKDSIVYDINEDNQKLSILLEVDSNDSSALWNEKYGYFINDNNKGKFYDVLNDETIDFNNEYYTAHFDTYYLDFEDFVYNCDYFTGNERREYALNKGLTKKSLLRIDGSFHSISDETYKIYFHNWLNYYSDDFKEYNAETYFKDKDFSKESTTLTKK